MNTFSWRSARWFLLVMASSSSYVLSSCGAESHPSQAGDDAPAALNLEQAPKIESVSMEGPGCPEGDPFAIGISGSRDTFRIQFGAFSAATHGDAETAESSCTVTVALEGTQGVSYAPLGVTLAASTNAPATLATTGWWTSAPGETSDDATNFPGRGSYLTGALNDPLLWSPCSGARTLRFMLKLSVDGRQRSATVDRLSNLRFGARACTEADASRDGGVDQPDDAQVVTDDAGRTEIDADLPDAEADLPDAVVVPAPPDAGPPPAAVVSNVLTAGSACPPNSTVVKLAEMGDGFDVRFSQFVLATTAEQTIRTSDCSVNLQVDVPAGHTVALERLALEGAAQLPAGATARFTTYYSYVGGPPNSASKVVPLAGPFDAPFALAAEYVDGDLLFRNCGESARRLNIRVALSIRAGDEGAVAQASLARLGDVRFVSRPCE